MTYSFSKSRFKRRAGVLAVASLLSLLGLLVACGGGSTAADTVFRNGQVYTADDKDTVAQAVAVRAGRIVYAGSNEGVAAYIQSGTKVIDLGGRMLMPGLVDGHIHPITGAAATLKCSLQYLPLTVVQMQAMIQDCLTASASSGDDVWLEVVNWDRQSMSAIDRDPVRADLDALPTNRPIIVTSIDLHSRLLNSKGLATANITRNTANPSDGTVVKDSAGEPTGILEDGAALLADAALPALTDADRLNLARVALDLLRRQGVTTFMHAMGNEPEVKAFATLAQSGELTARTQVAMLAGATEAANPGTTIANFQTIAAKYKQAANGTSPTVEVRHIKLFLDGVLQAPAQTGFLLAPYLVNQGTTDAPNWVPGTKNGVNYVDAPTLNAFHLAAAKAGFDTHVHAIGDAAVREALDAIAYTRQQLPRLKGWRPAIAHVELADPADYGRFKSLDTVAVMSFQWMQRAPYSVEAVQDQLGPERYARMEPEGSLYQAGATISYGSDWPVDPLAYFYNLRVGVTRSSDPTHPASFGPAYAGRLNNDPLLPRTAVLRAITRNAAYQLHMEGDVGSIERGKLADLIILDRNFLTAPESDLAYTKVLMTVVGGKTVWTDEAFTPEASSTTSTPLAAAATSVVRAASIAVKSVLPMHLLNALNATGHVPTTTGDGHRH